MDALLERTVLLPDGKRVAVCNSPQPWWKTDGGSGYISPKLLAPDPNQPREHMDETELEELTQSIAVRGVRDPLTVTPLALSPWVVVAAEHKDLPFVIVGGHRRTAGAIRAGVEAIPIRVVAYESEADYLIDVSVLNNNRANLSPLEEGREIVRLRSKGVTLEKVAKSLGRSLTHVQMRINLTRLAPELLPLLKLNLKSRDRFPLVVAEKLGGVEVPTQEELEELLVIFKADIMAAPLTGSMLPGFNVDNLDEDGRRFHLQKILLAVVLRRSLNAKRAVEFIHEHHLQMAAARGTSGTTSVRLQPKRRKEVLMGLRSEVMGSAVIDWSPDEFRRIFETSTPEEVEKYRLAMHEAATYLTDVESILKKIFGEKIRAMQKK